MTLSALKPGCGLAALALGRSRGLSEHALLDGRPLWEQLLPKADAVLEAPGWEDMVASRGMAQ